LAGKKYSQLSLLETLIQKGSDIFQNFIDVYKTQEEQILTAHEANPFHSVVICPVTKDPVLNDRLMLIKCGHIISKYHDFSRVSLNKIVASRN
jgi:hypothetical protein